MEIQQVIDHRYCGGGLQCRWVSLPVLPWWFLEFTQGSGFLRLEWKLKLHGKNQCVLTSLLKWKHICYMVDEGIIKWRVLANVNNPQLQWFQAPVFMWVQSKKLRGQLCGWLSQGCWLIVSTRKPFLARFHFTLHCPFFNKCQFSRTPRAQKFFWMLWDCLSELGFLWVFLKFTITTTTKAFSPSLPFFFHLNVNGAHLSRKLVFHL